VSLRPRGSCARSARFVPASEFSKLLLSRKEQIFYLTRRELGLVGPIVNCADFGSNDRGISSLPHRFLLRQQHDANNLLPPTLVSFLSWPPRPHPQHPPQSLPSWRHWGKIRACCDVCSGFPKRNCPRCITRWLDPNKSGLSLITSTLFVARPQSSRHYFCLVVEAVNQRRTRLLGPSCPVAAPVRTDSSVLWTEWTNSAVSARLTRRTPSTTQEYDPV